eukprot:GSA25T00017476001.1
MSKIRAVAAYNRNRASTRTGYAYATSVCSSSSIARSAQLPPAEARHRARKALESRRPELVLLELKPWFKKRYNSKMYTCCPPSSHSQRFAPGCFVKKRFGIWTTSCSGELVEYESRRGIGSTPACVLGQSQGPAAPTRIDGVSPCASIKWGGKHH